MRCMGQIPTTTCSLRFRSACLAFLLAAQPVVLSSAEAGFFKRSASKSHRLQKPTIQDGRFVLRGSPWHATGVNWTGIAYGQNFGATAWYPHGNGFSRHPQLLAEALSAMRAEGISIVRVGLLDDGRALLDATGHLARDTRPFDDDVEALLRAAERHELLVEFVLVDFHVAGRAEMVNGVSLRGRAGLLTDPLLREAFRTQVLEPFLRRWGAHPALWGFDLINEPEWLVANTEGGGWDDVKPGDPARTPHPIARRDLTLFAQTMAETIHRLAPKALVTMGVSLKFIGLVQGLRLDYYAVHHYPWMESLGNFRELCGRIPRDKPWMLEEHPATGAPLTPAMYRREVRKLGGGGTYLWGWKP